MALLSAFPATNILGLGSSTVPQYVSPTSSVQTTGTPLTITTDFRTAIFFLNVIQLPAFSSALLDVYVQHSPDGGTTWDDFVHFNQISGKVSSSNATQIAQWVRDTAASSSNAGNFLSVRTPTTQSLAAGLVMQGPIGATWRGIATVNAAFSSSTWRLNLQAQVAQ